VVGDADVAMIRAAQLEQIRAEQRRVLVGHRLAEHAAQPDLRRIARRGFGAQVDERQLVVAHVGAVLEHAPVAGHDAQPEDIAASDHTAVGLAQARDVNVAELDVAADVVHRTAVMLQLVEEHALLCKRQWE
jgi:hypothetical protein